MVHTVFIASLALGTVPEFQILPVQLRASADRAPVAGSALGPNLHFLFKLLLPVDLLWGVPLVIPGHQKEGNHIGQGEQDHTPGCQIPENKGIQVQAPVCHCQPFSLHRKHKEQPELGIRKADAEGQEQGQVQISCGKDLGPSPQEIDHQTGQHLPDDSQQEEGIEPEGPPDILQGLPQVVVQEQGNNSHKNRIKLPGPQCRRIDHKGHHPPDLAVKKGPGIQGQIPGIHPEESHGIHDISCQTNCVKNNNIVHQIADCIPAVLPLQLLKKLHPEFLSVKIMFSRVCTADAQT